MYWLQSYHIAESAHCCSGAGTQVWFACLSELVNETPESKEKSTHTRGHFFLRIGHERTHDNVLVDGIPQKRGLLLFRLRLRAAILVFWLNMSLKLSRRVWIIYEGIAGPFHLATDEYANAKSIVGSHYYQRSSIIPECSPQVLKEGRKANLVRGIQLLKAQRRVSKVSCPNNCRVYDPRLHQAANIRIVNFRQM